MLRKIYLFIIICTLSVLAGACSTENETSVKTDLGTDSIVTVTPSQLLPLTQVQQTLSYTVKEGDSNEHFIIYFSDPIGQNDSVSLSMEQYSKEVPKETIKAHYDNAFSKRPSAEPIADIADAAFIAYPSIHIYRDGYHIKITAGSGCDQYHHDLLVYFANIVSANLDACLTSK